MKNAFLIALTDTTNSTKFASFVLLMTVCLVVGRAQVGAPQPEPARQAPQDDYIIGSQDVLNITVWENADLTGKFTVQPDGSITLPLVGRVKAAGLSLRGFEKGLTAALADGFLRDPRVVVALDQFRGQRVFIFGAVSSPGPYALQEGQTLIEALVRAGYAAASQVVIVRPKHPSGPTLPEDAGDAEVIRVNLRELEKDVEHGSLARNIPLRDGDTIFIPRTDPTRIFVTGQVRNPGAYSITEDTTVLQALALAGGLTESAAINRLRIMRIVDGKQKTFNAKITDVVRPGDTLVVPERYF
jgi:polysaccharide export outer membrane protein